MNEPGLTASAGPLEDGDGGVLYEARYTAATADAAGFDTWLRDRIADVLQCPGFQSAEILDESPPTAPGTVSRTVQYRVRNQESYRAFADTQSAALESIGTFSATCTISRRVLASRELMQHGAVSTENCLNCGEVLRGQHCLHCGQRARVRVLSLWALLRDMLGDLLDWDARIWRTLRPLAFRPGVLTQEFLRGRRTYYTPPFRMYLILSVAFFLVVSVSNDLELDLDGTGASLHIGNETEQVADTPAAPAPAPPPELDADRSALVDTIVGKLPLADRERARRELELRVADMDAAEFDSLKSATADPCGPDTLQIGIGPLAGEYEPRLRDACRKIVADSRGFGRALYANVPRMMFLFLPLIALLMMLLYAGSGRYYVEHVVFFVHYHAYFFLGGLVIALLERAGSAFAGTAAAEPLASGENAVITAFVLWSPVYLFVAMRRVYGQSRLLTFAKYTLLLLGYLFGMVLTGVGLLLYTALSL